MKYKFHHSDGRVFKSPARDHGSRALVVGDWGAFDEDVIYVTRVRSATEFDCIEHPRAEQIIRAMLDSDLSVNEAIKEADCIARLPFVKLTNWCVITRNVSADTETHLAGIVHGHHDIPDGKDIVTSKITAAHGRLITTEQTVYELGEPNAEYLTYLKSIGFAYDSSNPIRHIN
jgi:hypothetical protein